MPVSVSEYIKIVKNGTKVSYSAITSYQIPGVLIQVTPYSFAGIQPTDRLRDV